MLFLSLLLLLILFSFRGIQFSSQGLKLDSTLVLRGILVLLVIFHHVPVESGISWLKLLQGWSGRYAVALFFFMSGYGLTLQYSKAGNGFFQNFFSKRYTKLLIPYIVAWLLYFALSGNYSLHAIWSRALVGDNVIPFAYFVEELALFYALYYLCFRFLSANYAMLLMFALTLGLMSAFYHMGWNDHWWISSLGFPMGILVCRFRHYFCRLNAVGILWAAISAVLLLWIRDKELYLRVWCFVYLLVPAACFLLSMVFPAIKWASYSPLLYLGKISYETYIFQGIALVLALPYSLELNALLIGAICILLGFVFSAIDKKLSSAVTRLWQ